ncbi:MAG: phage major capsid protein [Acidimicrobiia bacterium]|nr:phage major capsid protein [Acidimicrobiia bacterium]
MQAMTLKQLLAARTDLVEQAKQIETSAAAEDRDLTDVEVESISKCLDEADGLTEQINKAEDVAACRTRLEEATSVVSSPPPASYAPPTPAASMPRISSPREPWEDHVGSLKAFSNDPTGRRNAYEVGQWFKATHFGDRRANEWCNLNGVQIGNVAEEGSNPAGGYLVPSPMSNAIIDLRDQFGVARQELNFVPMSSDTLTIPKVSSGTTVYAVGENVEITAADAKWASVTLNARKWAALSRISSELVDDAIISVIDWLTTDFARSFAEKEDDSLFNGDGTSTYHGIYGVRPKIVDGNHTTGAVDLETGDNTFAEITLVGIHDVVGALEPQWHGTAKFYMSQQCWSTAFERLMAASGGNTTTTLAAGVGLSFLGYPVVLSQKMPTSTGDLENVAMFLFGDLNAAVAAGERRGFRTGILRERYAELDQVGVMATTRFDFSVHGLGDTSTSGPIVAGVGA